MKRWTLLAASLTLAATSAVTAQDAPDLEMWRLDCGTLEISDIESFSDAHLYDGVAMTLTVSCYLLRNGERYFLWDTGLSDALVGSPMTVSVYSMTVERSLLDQLGDIGLAAADIDMVGLSHMHFDHVGQAGNFPAAELLIGAGDAEAIAAGADANVSAALANWFGEGATGKLSPVAKDRDVFGDGSVTMIATPGHTPGHTALLVRLPETGPIMLTGDLYHFEEQVTNRGVPQFNTDRADTLASMARFDQTAQSLNATPIIQHDPRQIDRLPAFPASAK